MASGQTLWFLGPQVGCYKVNVESQVIFKFNQKIQVVDTTDNFCADVLS